MPYYGSATLRLYETFVRLAEKPKNFRLRRLGRLRALGTPGGTVNVIPELDSADDLGFPGTQYGDFNNGEGI